MLCSPQQRALDTAKKIYKLIIQSESAFEEDKNLIEISAGIFESLAKKDLNEKHSDKMPHFIQKS